MDAVGQRHNIIVSGAHDDACVRLHFSVQPVSTGLTQALIRHNVRGNIQGCLDGNLQGMRDKAFLANIIGNVLWPTELAEFAHTGDNEGQFLFHEISVGHPGVLIACRR